MCLIKCKKMDDRFISWDYFVVFNYINNYICDGESVNVKLEGIYINSKWNDKLNIIEMIMVKLKK